MGEQIILVYKDGSRLVWNTSNLKDGAKAINLLRSKGDPVEVIGEGKAAKHLRERYSVYHANPDNYKVDVVGGIQAVVGTPKEVAEKMLKAAKAKLRLKS